MIIPDHVQLLESPKGWSEIIDLVPYPEVFFTMCVCVCVCGVSLPHVCDLHVCVTFFIALMECLLNCLQRNIFYN
jgi:hypothetical protein